MSKSRSHISNTLNFNSSERCNCYVRENFLTSGQARPLIGITNASSIAEEIVSKNYGARKVEYLVRNKSGRIDKKVDTNILKTQKKSKKFLDLK